MKLIIQVVCMATLLCISAVAWAQMPPANVRVESVLSQEMREHQKAIGTLKASSEAEVATREEGAVLTVSVEEGDQVRKGDKLVVLDKDRLELQLKETKASLTTAQSMVEQREAEFQRAEVDFEMKESLYQQKAVSLKDFLDSQREQKVAKARLESSRNAVAEIASQLEMLSVRLDDMIIKAPFDGWVTDRHVEPGEWLSVGSAVVTMISSGDIEAWVNVPERLIDTVSDDNIEIMIDALGQRISSKSVKIIPKIDPRSRTLQLVAKLEINDERLSPGMSVSAWLPTSEKKDRLVVSNDAIVRNQFGNFVYKAMGNDTGHVAQQVPVNILFSKEGLTVIESAMLVEDDLVIVEGNERIFPNTPLNILHVSPGER